VTPSRYRRDGVRCPEGKGGTWRALHEPYIQNAEGPKPAAILSLISFFSVLSILSIGGSNSVVPEMARHAVEVELFNPNSTS
jgi:hypothetical protein